MSKASFYDSMNLLGKLSGARLLNASKIISSFYFSRIMRRPFIWGKPVSISLEPTTSCNLRCPQCPSGLRSFTRATGMAEAGFFKKIIDELSNHLFYITFYFQGEPFLNPAFFEMVRYAHKKNIYTATSTNAHFLHFENARKTVESGLDRLIISVDGTSQEVYEQYRIGGNFKKVVDGAKNVISWKKKLHSRTPHVILQFIVFRHNEHQLHDIKKIANDLEVDELRFKTAQVYDFENGNDFIPSDAKYSRYKNQDDGIFSIKNKLLNHCWKMWHSCVITWDGKILPCCFDKDAQHVLGDLNNRSFEELWRSDRYQQFRQSLLRSRKEIDICKNCSEGTAVWI